MFPALLAYLQDALHKRNLVYCMRVMPVGCPRIGAPRCIIIVVIGIIIIIIIIGKYTISFM
jgi:hypothetical protein